MSHLVDFAAYSGFSEKRPVDAHSDKMVYLNNLPFDLKWNTLKDIIREKVGQVNSLKTGFW